MSKLLHINDEDIAMRFESLIVGAFDQYGKFDDPLSFGAQDSYADFVYEDDPVRFTEGKMNLAYAIGAICYRFPDGEHLKKLSDLFQRIIEATNQEEIIAIIDECLAIMRELGI